MKEAVKTRLHPRRLARQMARRSLDRMGATGYNRAGTSPTGKRDPKAGSLFSRKWRELAADAAKAAGRKRR